ncbi:deoxyribonuclease IV [bacterium]|nr:deoxyribonuclease IV [bacterium]
MRYLGAHVSVAGGLQNGIITGIELGINTIQIHPTAPQRWISKPVDTAGIETMIKAQKHSPVKIVFAHAIYLINLAQPDKQKFHLGKMALVHYLDFMKDVDSISKSYESDLQAGGVVVHVGSAIHYPNKQEALERVSYGINWILENSRGGELLLESSAGSGQVIGEKLEDLHWLYEKTEQKDRIGIALDTEHMFASGYDWTKTDEVVHEVENVLPLDLVKVIHLNDSKVPCGSKKDRHENLGEGLIGEEALKRVINHKKLKNIPMVLETPRMKSIDEAKIDIAKLKDWAEN